MMYKLISSKKKKKGKEKEQNIKIHIFNYKGQMKKLHLYEFIIYSFIC